MSKYQIHYEVGKFPTSEFFQVFKVLGDVIWQVISVPAFNIDNGYIEYYNLSYDDPITAGIIAEELNRAESEING